VGFTYLIAPELGTLIKGGTGVFFDLPYTFTGSGLTPGAYPFGNDVIDGPIPLSGGLIDAPVPPPSLDPPYGRMIAYDDEVRTPYAVQWSVGAEQRLGSHGSLSAAYVGAAGHRLGRVESLRDVFADFTRLDVVRTVAASDYHSLQLQYRLRAGAGLHALLSYTLGRSTDTVSNESISNFQAPFGTYDPERDRGPSDFDVRHTLVGAVSYTVPSGLLREFGFDGFVRARSSLPVNVVTGTDPFGLGYRTVARPDVVPGVDWYLDDPSAPGGRRINAAAFAPPEPDRQGTLTRNALRGLPAWQADVSARRDVRLSAGVRAQLRLDIFNVFNHANFANPSGNLSSSSFGVATQMLNRGLGGVNPLYQIGGPRSMQLSLRVSF
jgi:hypothetical protein